MTRCGLMICEGQTRKEFFEAVQREHKKTKAANRLMQPLQMANIHHMNPRRFYFLALPSNWRSSMEGLSKRKVFCQQHIMFDQ